MPIEGIMKLRELTVNGKLEKRGRGRDALYNNNSSYDNGEPVVGFLNAEDSKNLFLKVAS